MARKLSWDGEKIKEEVSEEPKKHTPKDILNGLDHVRNQINQQIDQQNKMVDQATQLATNLASAKKFEKELLPFEDECIRIQTEKIKFIIDSNPEYITQAREAADIEIAKSPDAYDDRQAKILPFLKYQNMLASDKKMVEKISSRMIRECLFDKPIYENPFKD